jgi:hypothetical protein
MRAQPAASKTDLTYRSKEPSIKMGDVGIGLAAAVVTFVLSVLTPGSFNFATPWLFWSVVVLFFAGASRRLQANENIWLKAATVNLSWFVFVPLLLQAANGWGVVPIIAGTILPTAAGIYSRQRLIAVRQR